MAVPRSGVVVGIDGTSRSVAALRWAAAEADRRNTDLLVVLAAGSQPQPSAAPAALERCLHEAFGTRPSGQVRSVCDERQAVPALLAHCAEAALLVLAARADPRHHGLVLGNVSRDCLQLSPCPVVVLLTDPVSAAAATPVDDVLVADVAAG